MSGDSNSIDTGCEKTIANLEKDFTTREDHAEEQSTLLGHIEDSGTKAEEETKLSSNFATAEAAGHANREAGHVKNDEDKGISHGGQANIEEQFVSEEVSAILYKK